jgi:hypothetical protein
MGLPSLSATRQTPTKKFLREGYKGSSAIDKINRKKGEECKKTHQRTEGRERKHTGGKNAKGGEVK